MTDGAAGAGTGRVALVTGAGSGIGAATARRLAGDGIAVLVIDLDGGSAQEVADSISAGGGQARAQRADVTRADDVAAMVACVRDEWGRLDVAVNNAGTPGTYAPLPDQQLGDWERTLAVNLTGVFLCLQAEIPAMVESGGGAVVNVASAAGLMGFAHLPAYVASKHGVIGLTKSVALEYARTGVRVNAVCPGNVDTPMLERFARGNRDALLGMGKVTPIGRLAEPDEIAEAIAWLCSDAASFVTGHALAVDGGVLAT